MELTSQQVFIRDYPMNTKVFLRGEAGTGKTTAAVARLKKMLDSGVYAESILILVPQRPLAKPYSLLASDPDLPAGGQNLDIDDWRTGSPA